jgi:hypothetical protein
MEVGSTFETLVNSRQATRRNNTEDSRIHKKSPSLRKNRRNITDFLVSKSKHRFPKNTKRRDSPKRCVAKKETNIKNVLFEGQLKKYKRFSFRNLDSAVSTVYKTALRRKKL